MPSTGPHASFILDPKKNPIQVVDATESIAARLKQEANARERDELARALASIDIPVSRLVKIFPGDVLSIEMWSQGESSSTSSVGVTPDQKKMGQYTVDMKGQVDLPYVGLVSIIGMTPHEAERAIATRYIATAVFSAIDISVKVEQNKGQNIVVMGAVNMPTVVNWDEGGVDMAEAIAHAGGFKVFDPSKEGSDLSVNNVLLVRGGVDYNIPMRTALAQTIPLHPGDRVVLQHKPVVRALCLGGGWKTPTVVPFETQPTLSQVMAGAGDLNPATAQGRAIFVFKHDRDIIYRINFDHPDGMEAAQKFPISDQDMIYVPTSRSVTLQQAVSIIMSVAYPAAMGAAI